MISCELKINPEKTHSDIYSSITHPSILHPASMPLPTHSIYLLRMQLTITGHVFSTSCVKHFSGKQQQKILFQTSPWVKQSVCLEPVPPPWCLLTFKGNSQGSTLNISWPVSSSSMHVRGSVSRTWFSLLPAPHGLQAAAGFLRTTTRWWVFLLHDTTRFARPVLLVLLGQVAGNLNANGHGCNVNVLLNIVKRMDES